MANAKYTIKHPVLEPKMEIGRWRLIEVRPKPKKPTMWFCKCKCGTEREVLASSLKGEVSLSCGCYQQEVISRVSTKHNMSHSRTYRCCWGMKQRCYQQSHGAYKDYGGRGIKVCDDWLESFENFLADMGQCPSSKHSLDRYPNNNGNYEKSNCRWATMAEQNRNTRRNHWVEIDGRTQTVTDWAAELDRKLKTVFGRIHAGWDAKEALLTPIPKDGWETRRLMMKKRIDNAIQSK